MAGALIPSAGALAAPGDVYVSDYSSEGGGGAVYHVPAAGGARTLIASGTPFEEPRGIAKEPAGTLILADAKAGSLDGAILRIDPATGAKTVLSSGGLFEAPEGVALDATGSILVADPNANGGDGAILRIDPVTGAQSTVSPKAGQPDFFKDPEDVLVEAAGTLLVVDRGAGAAGAVLRVDPATGAQTIVYNAGLINAHEGLASAPDGTVYVSGKTTAGGQGAIFRLEAGGAVIVTSGGNLVDPEGIAVASNGDILVADRGAASGNGAIIRVTPLGVQSVFSVGGAFRDPSRLVLDGAPGLDASASGNDVTLTCTAEAGTTVKFYDGTTLLATYVADASGVVTHVVQDAAEGTHTYTCSETDGGGNEWTSEPVDVTIDTTAPDKPSLAASVDGGNDVTLTCTSAEPGSTVTFYEGTTVVGSATADSEGSAQLVLTDVADGEHSYTCTSTDAADNESEASDAVDVSIDTSAPDKPALDASVTDGNDVTLTCTGEAGSTVEFFEGATSLGTAVADGAGVATLTLDDVADGTYSYTCTSTDADDNTSEPSDAASVTIDTTAPDAPVIDATGSGSNVTIKCTTEPGATVEFYDGTTLVGTVVADAAGVATLALANVAVGTHTYTCTATDAAGNVSDPSAGDSVTVAAPPTGGGGSTGGGGTTPVTPPVEPAPVDTRGGGTPVPLLDPCRGAGDANRDGLPDNPTPGCLASLTATQLVLTCEGTRLRLMDVSMRRSARKVTVIGVAAPALVGSKVTLYRVGSRVPVGTALVGTDGMFRGLVKAPAKAARAGGEVRYIARSGAVKSRALKLTRRLLVSPLTFKNGKVRISGRVVKPLAKPRAKVTIRRFIDCKRLETVGKAKPKSSGKFSISLAPPVGARAAIYQAITVVPRRPGSKKLSRTYTLPVAVDLR